MTNPYVVWLDQLRLSDLPQVGGKNASLGEMIGNLSALGVSVPGGFATTASGFSEFIEFNQIKERIYARLAALNIDDVNALVAAGAEIRGWVHGAQFPAAFEAEIRRAYGELELKTGLANPAVAVRSSATAEDLPDASFAGQQETFLNVTGADSVLARIKEVFASLYNDRAISYRVHHGFKHEDVFLSAGIQQMVRSVACRQTRIDPAGFRQQAKPHGVFRKTGRTRADRAGTGCRAKSFLYERGGMRGTGAASTDD